jgi:methyl-accepting chemotaxis protein
MLFAAAQVVDVARQAAEADRGAPTFVYWLIILGLVAAVVVLARALHTAHADARRPLIDENGLLRAALSASTERRLEDIRELIPLVRDVLHQLLQGTSQLHGTASALAELIELLRRTNKGLVETKADLEEIAERISSPGDTPPRGPQTRRGGERDERRRGT